MIDQVGSRLDHSPCPATGAETPTLATERHQVFVAAAVTFDAQEAVLQQAAFQVLFELPADESGEMATRAFDLLNEPRIIFSNGSIERGLFWSMPMVGTRDGDRRRSRLGTCMDGSVPTCFGWPYCLSAAILLESV